MLPPSGPIHGPHRCPRQRQTPNPPPPSAAIRPGRGLLVGGNPQRGGESYTANDVDVVGPVTQYTVPGTDVLVVDTTPTK